MLIETKDIITMTDANQNFSMVARRTDRDGKTGGSVGVRDEGMIGC